MALESGLSSQVRSLRQPQGGRITSEGQYGKDIDWISRYPPDELKIISLTLGKLLRNLSRLGDYTQRVRPGAHPFLYQQDMVGNHHVHRKTSFKYHKVRLNPPALGGLTEVDLCTSLPSGVPEPGRLPCSVTRLHLLGVQDSAVRRRGSSED